MSWQVNRRTFLAAASAAAVTQSVGLAAEKGARAKTYTYKTVGDLEIKADVLRPDDEKIRPVVVWIHGDKDRDVPYGQSVMMDNELARHGVEHKLITISGGGHGFGGTDLKHIADAYQQAVAFVRKHMEE